MSSPKSVVLDAVSVSAYPLTKSSLLDRLEAENVDSDVIAAASALEAYEFGDRSELEDALDLAFGVPDANASGSVLEIDYERGLEVAPSELPPAVDPESVRWFGEGGDLTVAGVRSLFEGLDDRALVRVELEDADVSEMLVPIAVRTDEQTGAVVLEVGRLNSA